MYFRVWYSELESSYAPFVVLVHTLPSFTEATHCRPCPFLGTHPMGQSNSIVNCSNDYELVIRASKELEFLLETSFSATNGKQSGLHDKISSARQLNGQQLPDGLVRKMRYLATLRSKLIHDRECHNIPDRTRFSSLQAKEAIAELKVLCPAISEGGGCVVS